MEHNADHCIYPAIHVHITLGNEDLTVKVLFFCFTVLKVILIRVFFSCHEQHITNLSW